MPALLGEILAGVIIGLSLQHAVNGPSFLLGLSQDSHLQVLTELGIFFLMLLGGIELKPRELLSVSLPALAVAVCAMLLPMAGGMALAWQWLPDTHLRSTQALFVGVALAITAVPVSVKVLMDLGCLHTRLGNLVVAAAVIDDLLSLVVLSVLTAMIRTGEMPSGIELWILAGQIGAFLMIVVAVDKFLVPRIWPWVTRIPVDEMPFSTLMILGVSLAVVAHLLGLHFIMGAFAAGLVLQSELVGEPAYRDLHLKVSAITKGLLAPLFFASIGMELDLSVVWTEPVFVFLLLLIAISGKLLGGALPARAFGFSKRESWAAGMAMSARGAVELIIAGIALRAGLFDLGDQATSITENLFSAIVLVAVVTTLLAPIGLRLIIKKSA